MPASRCTCLWAVRDGVRLRLQLIDPDCVYHLLNPPKEESR
jgi:hypothetical protein